MTDTENDRRLALAYARLSKAAARRKIYSHKAAKDGRPETALFLRAMAASEAVQARRLFNSLIGRVDRSDKYLAAIFEKEVRDIIDSYSDIIAGADSARPALLHAISQLRAAETRLRSFYSPDVGDVNVKKNARYFVCRFCGYLGTDNAPEKCPICGAPESAFDRIE